MKCTDVAMRITEYPDIYIHAYYCPMNEIKEWGKEKLNIASKSNSIKPFNEIMNKHIIVNLGIIAILLKHSYITAKEALLMGAYMDESLDEYKEAKELTDKFSAIKKVLGLYQDLAPWADIIWHTAYIDFNGKSEFDSELLLEQVKKNTSFFERFNFMQKYNKGAITSESVQVAISKLVNDTKGQYFSSADVRYCRSKYREWFTENNLPGHIENELICAIETPGEAADYFADEYSNRIYRFHKLRELNAPAIIMYHESRALCMCMFPLCVADMSYRQEDKSKAKDFIEAHVEKYRQIVEGLPSPEGDALEEIVSNIVDLCDEISAILSEKEGEGNSGFSRSM